MFQQKYARLMPHVCNTCKLVYVLILGKYVNVHASDELNEIDTV